KKDSFALIRPPGHHACRNRGMGFCLLNNIAIAANHLIENEKNLKILILDLDCHHGNGTQEIFYDRNDVFYVSLHQYPFYPGTGSEDEIGEGKGKYYTKNIPLKAYTDDKTYLEKLKIFENIAIEYNPDVILISMGYDTYIEDLLTLMNITIEGYYKISKFIKEVAKEIDVGVGFFLEGGYNLKGLSYGVLNTIKAFEE
ncbi:MAG: histone deacetylase, partial [Candidatus Altarchaeaceae archaeon]